MRKKLDPSMPKTVCGRISRNRQKWGKEDDEFGISPQCEQSN